MPCRLGLPSGVRGVAGVWASAASGAAERSAIAVTDAARWFRISNLPFLLDVDFRAGPAKTNQKRGVSRRGPFAVRPDSKRLGGYVPALCLVNHKMEAWTEAREFYQKEVFPKADINGCRRAGCAPLNPRDEPCSN